MDDPEAVSQPVEEIDRAHVTEDNRENYRRLSSHIVKGLAIVSAIYRGRDYAAVVSAYLSVSYDPPTLLISVFEDGRAAEAVEAADRWTLNIVNEQDDAIVDWLSSPGNPLLGLLKPVPHLRRGPSTPVIVDGALAWFEVETTAIHEAATHLLVVGEVRAMGNARREGHDDGPLLRYDGQYRRLAP